MARAKKPKKDKTPKPMGRPTIRTEAMISAFLERIAEGKSVSDVCLMDDMPTRTAIYEWMLKDQDFADKYARACESRADVLVDEIIAIADDDSRDWEPIKNAEGTVIGVRVDGEHVQRSRLRIDTRLKLLSKWDPKRYGEKTTMDLNAVVEQRLPLPQLQAEIKRMLDKGVIDVESQEVKP
jgi:hypothetical protein